LSSLVKNYSFFGLLLFRFIGNLHINLLVVDLHLN
jgi:hypothetical protein